MQELKALKTKVDAGAELLLSQLFFDNRLFYDFASDCKNNGITVPVTPGIMPVTSAAQIQRMVKMCGRLCRIPCKKSWNAMPIINRQ